MPQRGRGDQSSHITSSASFHRDPAVLPAVLPSLALPSITSHSKGDSWARPSLHSPSDPTFLLCLSLSFTPSLKHFFHTHTTYKTHTLPLSLSLSLTHTHT